MDGSPSSHVVHSLMYLIDILLAEALEHGPEHDPEEMKTYTIALS